MTPESIDALVKVLASGGLTVVLLYAAITLWNAFQAQTSARIKDLQDRVAALEGKTGDKT